MSLPVASVTALRSTGREWSPRAASSSCTAADSALGDAASNLGRRVVMPGIGFARGLLSWSALTLA
jgi:hypothetical protein